MVTPPKHADTSEVYILMEYCAGGHLVGITIKKNQYHNLLFLKYFDFQDIMNSKPQRFSESDILSIFHDVCQAVAHMHSQVSIYYN